MTDEHGPKDMDVLKARRQQITLELCNLPQLGEDKGADKTRAWLLEQADRLDGQIAENNESIPSSGKTGLMMGLYTINSSRNNPR